MKTLSHLFENNRAWSEKMTRNDPSFFRRLTAQQAPKYLWIGCSDSRVPANEIVDLLPGELFVHRNVANLVVPKDVNCQSVIQFAVEALKVEHIIVCGHYGCGGVRAVIDNREFGLVSKWLGHLAKLKNKSAAELKSLAGADERTAKLCELSVVEQVRNVSRSAAVRKAWKKGHTLHIHGWIYSLDNGLLQDLLEKPVTSAADQPKSR